MGNIDVCFPPMNSWSAILWPDKLLRAACNDLSDVTSHMCSMDHGLVKLVITIQEAKSVASNVKLQDTQVVETAANVTQHNVCLSCN